MECAGGIDEGGRAHAHAASRSPTGAHHRTGLCVRLAAHPPRYPTAAESVLVCPLTRGRMPKPVRARKTTAGRPKAAPWSDPSRHGELELLATRAGCVLNFSRAAHARVCAKGARSTLPLVHLACGSPLTSEPTINNLRNGQRVACLHCAMGHHTYRDRFAEASVICGQRGLELLESPTEWERQYSGQHTYCPRVRCPHGVVSTQTTFHRILRGGTVRCARCVGCVTPFVAVAAACAERDAELLETTETWDALCAGQNFVPRIRCVCGHLNAVTRVRDLVAGGWLGCRCGA